MATKRGLLILLIVFVVGMTGYLITSPSPGSTSASMVPDIDLPLSAPAKPTRMAALRGKVVLLDFWATTCGPCKMSMPAIQSLYTKYKDQGLAVIGVSEDMPESGQDLAPVKSQVEKVKAGLGVTYPTVLAIEMPDVGNKFPHDSIPQLYVIDKEGKIRDTEAGWDPEGSRARLDDLIKKLLSE